MTAEAKPITQAERLIEGAIRMAESEVARCQNLLTEKIAAEKREHDGVELWKEELNKAVAARQELEGSLRSLRALTQSALPTPSSSSSGGGG